MAEIALIWLSFSIYSAPTPFGKTTQFYTKLLSDVVSSILAQKVMEGGIDRNLSVTEIKNNSEYASILWNLQDQGLPSGTWNIIE